MSNRHVSPSQLNTAGNCLRQWWIERVEGIKHSAGDAAKRGTAFGDELGNLYGVDPHPCSPSARKDQFIAPHIRQEAKDMALFYKSQPDAWKSATEAEVPIEISTDRWAQLAEYYDLAMGRTFPCVGFVDFIQRNPEVHVLENKTSGRAEFRSSWTTQTHIYYLALQAVTAEIHLVADGSKGYRFLRYKVPVDKAALRSSIARCLRIMDMIGLALETDGETVFEQAGYWCSYCPANLSCATYRCAKLAPME